MTYKRALFLMGVVTMTFAPIQASAQISQTRQQTIDSIVLITPQFDGDNLDARNFHGTNQSRKAKLAKINYNNGLKHIEEGSLRKAESAFRKATYSPAFRLHAYYQLAFIHSEQGNPKKSQKYLNAFYQQLEHQNFQWNEDSQL